jgi:hypothetical protein
VSPISLKRGLYAGAVTAALSLLGATFVGIILLARSLNNGHASTSGSAILVFGAFGAASVLATAFCNVILVRPSARVSRGRVTAAVVALTAVVPLFAGVALLAGPHLIGNFGLVLGLSAPIALAVTLVVYVWARTLIPWVNRSAVSPA